MNVPVDGERDSPPVLRRSVYRDIERGEEMSKDPITGHINPDGSREGDWVASMTRNEAAERLRTGLREIPQGWDRGLDRILDAALVTERRLTVERVRERLADNHNTLGAEYYRLDQIEDLLDDLLAPTAARPEQDEAVRLTGEALYRTYWQAAVANSTDWPTQWERLSHPTRAVWESFAAALATPPPVPAAPKPYDANDPDWHINLTDDEAEAFEEALRPPVPAAPPLDVERIDKYLHDEGVWTGDNEEDWHRAVCEGIARLSTPLLDVERLARVLSDHFGPSYFPGMTDVTIHGKSPGAIAEQIAAEYARLSPAYQSMDIDRLQQDGAQE